jgi:rare lipoprotein A
LATTHAGHGRRFAAAHNRYICNYPIDTSGETQHGVAVYYGTGRSVGRMTANGERLDPTAFTAASPTLPLDSEADVRNLRNGRTLRVRINDRGPYGPGLLLDVTPAAAAELGMMGSGRDQVEILPVKETLN